MEMRLIKSLVEMVSLSSIEQLEISDARGAIRIARAGCAPVPPVLPAPAFAPAVPEPAPQPPAPELVKSTMVGLFHRAPSPGAAPYVRIGDTVKQGQTLAIIEAMKLHNEVQAPCSGVLRDVLVEDGAPVQFADPMFAIA